MAPACPTAPRRALVSLARLRGGISHESLAMLLDVLSLSLEFTADKDLETRNLGLGLSDLQLKRGNRRHWPRSLLVGEPRREAVRVSGRRAGVLLAQLTQPLPGLAVAPLDIRDALVDLAKLGPSVSCRRQAAKRVGFQPAKLLHWGHAAAVEALERLTLAATWPGGWNTSRSVRGVELESALSVFKR